MKNTNPNQGLSTLQKIDKAVENLFSKALRDIALIALLEDPTALTDVSFLFRYNPRFKKKIDGVIKDVAKGLNIVIESGVNTMWDIANTEHNERIKNFLGKDFHKLSKETKEKILNPNYGARNAFLKRKEKGLDLSKRVWNISQQFKQEIELSLEDSIRRGTSANQLATELKRKLKEPDKLFRRVRNEKGDLEWSKKAKDYKTGRGVYKSSFKNARRLAVTEGNIAYSLSNYERIQQDDLIVGIEIKLSNNHTSLDSKGVPRPFTDICDHLQGKYPKDFKFTGWHPHCRCHAHPIPLSRKDLEERRKARREGKAMPESENLVKEAPENFKQWKQENNPRIEQSRKRNTLPYFIKDNPKYFNLPKQKPSLIERAKQRQERRTKEQELEIQKKWNRRQTLQKAKQRQANRTQEQRQQIQQKWDERKERLKENAPKNYKSIQLDELKRLHKEQKLTPEQMKIVNDSFSGYVQTEHSFDINTYLRYGHPPLEREGAEKTLKVLDQLIGSNRLKEDIILHRYDEGKFLQYHFGIKKGSSLEDIITIINSSKGKTILDNGYCSTSAISKLNCFRSRIVYSEIRAKKGTPAFITNNYHESEVILKRGQKFKVVKAEVKEEWIKLILEVE